MQFQYRDSRKNQTDCLLRRCRIAFEKKRSQPFKIGQRIGRKDNDGHGGPLPLYGFGALRGLPAGECVHVTVYVAKCINYSCALDGFFRSQRTGNEQLAFFSKSCLRLDGLNHPCVRRLAGEFREWCYALLQVFRQFQCRGRAHEYLQSVLLR